MKLFLMVLICFVATLAGAISGIGGGIIIKPLLDAISGLPVATINFLSGCTVLAMAVVSLVRRRECLRQGDGTKKGHILLLCLGAAVGGVSGKEVFELARAAVPNQGLIMIIQNGVMLALTAGVFVYMRRKESVKTLAVTNRAANVAVGLGLGILSAFLGIGGGPINLMVLHYFYAMDTKEASFHSILIIFFSQLASLMITLAKGTPSFEALVLACMVLAGMAGGFLGSTLSKRMNHRQTDILFQILLLTIIVINFYNIVMRIIL